MYASVKRHLYELARPIKRIIWIGGREEIAGDSGPPAEQQRSGPMIAAVHVRAAVGTKANVPLT